MATDHDNCCVKSEHVMMMMMMMTLMLWMKHWLNITVSYDRLGGVIVLPAAVLTITRDIKDIYWQR